MFSSNYLTALEDYQRARRRAALQEVLSWLTGTQDENQLLSYDQVRQSLQAVEKGSQSLKEISLDAIIGSVGRYHDFTRKYLPKGTIDQKRWARVKASSESQAGLPPIDVYKIGEVYFVKDGNHRVSVARQMGNETIQAYVTEVVTRVPLDPDITPDEMIIKGEKVAFLERTGLDKAILELDLNATKPGAFPTLLEHIQVHRHYLGLEQAREIPYKEAAISWYKSVYLPVKKIILSRNLLEDFPERTAVDLYLWAADHQSTLSSDLGKEIGTEAALGDLSEKHSSQPRKVWERFRRNIMVKLIPDIFKTGPATGSWREKISRMTVLTHLFNDIIIALDDSKNTWNALDMALMIAQAENSRILGFHNHPRDDEYHHDHQGLIAEFLKRCQAAGIEDYRFKFSEGNLLKSLTEQVSFADLVILPLNHPPGNKPIQRLSSGITSIIRQSPVPLLTIPIKPENIQTLVLAYDGSPKAREALFITAYFGMQLNTKVIVVTSTKGINNPKFVLDDARDYLGGYPLQAEYILSEDRVCDVINQIAANKRIDLIIIGGFGGGSILDVMLGSVVDRVLREICLPVLICR
jgi:nucleotide-binding universal stress UspA family protein